MIKLIENIAATFMVVFAAFGIWSFGLMAFLRIAEPEKLQVDGLLIWGAISVLIAIMLYAAALNSFAA